MLIYFIYALALFGSLTAFFAIGGPQRSLFFWVGMYLLLAFVFQAGGIVVEHYFGSSFQWFNASMPAYYLVIFFIFYSLDQDPAYRQVIRIVFGLLLIPLIVALTPAIAQGYFASKTILVINLAVITVSLVYFYQLLKSPDLSPPMQQAPFLVTTAFLFYFLSSFITWAAYTLFQARSPELRLALGKINIGLVALFYLMLWWAIVVAWMQQRKLAK